MEQALSEAREHLHENIEQLRTQLGFIEQDSQDLNIELLDVQPSQFEHMRNVLGAIEKTTQIIKTMQEQLNEVDKLQAKTKGIEEKLDERVDTASSSSSGVKN